MQFAQLHLRERLDNLADRLPLAAERPTILRIDPGAEPILVASAMAEPTDRPAKAAVPPGWHRAWPRWLHIDAEGRIDRIAREVAVETE